MYGYQYDDLNRLLKGNYRKLGYSVTGNYDETLSYDKHGNIQTLQRNGFADADFGTSVEIDNLVYAYDGNQLLAVQDMSNSLNGFRDNVNNGTPDYGYDAYGNMTSDANKRIEDIDYNHLNLPTVINFQNNSGRIRYTYDALGVKLRKEVDDINGTTTTDYLDGFQYKNEVLSFFSTAEGYVEFKEPNRFFYVYNYTDHLGNVRMSYTDNGTAVPKILEESHYYPFGLKHENYASEKFNIVKEPNGDLYVIQPTERREWQYKFLGQERQDDLGLNWDTFRHRNYDFAIGRFMGIDPIAEKYMSISTYQFAHNSPVWKIELEGLEGVETTGKDIVNREPVYMSTNIIVSTVTIQESKQQNSRPGVPVLRMGIGVEKSESISIGAESAKIQGEATAYKANLGLAVCIDGERVEYGFTVGQINGEASAAGESVLNGQFTTLSAQGSYNIQSGEQQFDTQILTGEVNLNNHSNEDGDLLASIKGVGTYIELNLTEAGNNLKDFANLIMSYLKSVSQNYFNQNNTTEVSINPLR